MKRTVMVCMLIASCVLVGSKARAAEVTGNLNLLLGEKILSERDWTTEGGADWSKQFEAGIMFDIREKSWPVNIALDLLSSKKTVTIHGRDVDGKTSEFALGVRKYFREDQLVKPYVGGGLANITAEMSSGDNSSSASQIGPWIDGGVKFNPIKALNVGADVRYSQAETEINGDKIQAGGWHWGLFAGWNF